MALQSNAVVHIVYPCECCIGRASADELFKKLQTLDGVQICDRCANALLARFGQRPYMVQLAEVCEPNFQPINTPRGTA